MILLWGSLYDGPLAEVIEELSSVNASFLVIDQENILYSSMEINGRQGEQRKIVYLEKEYAADCFHSVYIRTYDLRQVDDLKGLGPADPLFIRACQFESDMGLWLDHYPNRVVNRISASSSNCSKPYQMEIIKSFGFQIPDTILTSSPDFAKVFLQKHKTIVYKSISSQRSIVSLLSEKESNRLDDVVWCPTQFQQYIAGTDYRVHVLGEKIFATKILSSQKDYRYSRDTSMIHCQLPEAIEENCFRITKHLGLHFSGIDLRCDPDGNWYCFEVNPSPGYTYYANATGQPITKELVRYLLE